MSAAAAVAAINAEIHDDGTRAVYHNSQPTHYPQYAYNDLMAAYPMAAIPGVGAAAPAAAATTTAAAAAAGSSAASVFDPAPVPAIIEPPQRQSRKRAKSQSSDDEGAEEGERKRPRGRPRLNPQDESAAERRRTQIRLAQRAYRNRKETTIQTLEKRVDDLRSANDEMAAAFKKLRDFAAAAGFLAKDAGFDEVLQSASQRFLDMAEQHQDAELDALVAGIPPQSSSSQPARQDKGKGRAQQPHSSAAAAAQHRPIYPAIHPQPPASSYENIQDTTRPHAHASAPLLGAPPRNLLPRPHESQSSRRSSEWPAGPDPPNNNPYSEVVYEVVAEPTPDNASFPSSLPIHDPEHEPVGGGSTTREPEEESHYIPMPHRWGYDVWKKLPTPIGYPHHERTFGRRLHRAGVELGISLVCNPNPPPHIYASVFGFCLLFESREQIRARLTEMLSKPKDQSLNNWKVPFVRLGGAGSHGLESGSGAGQGGIYGNQGLRDDHRPAHDTGFSMGPFTSLVEEARQSRLDCRMHMLLPGFQGDFFDPEDIELYLRNRGVSIPGNADYVEADINIDDFTEGEVPPQTTPYDGRVPRMTEMYDQAVTGALYMLHGPPLAPTEPMGWVSGREKEVLPQFCSNSSKKKRVVVSVEILINEINFRSVCLGRAPGTRPRDVNVAFWRSVTVKG